MQPRSPTLFLQDARRAALALYGTVLPDAASVTLHRHASTPVHHDMPYDAYRFFTGNHVEYLPYNNGQLCVWRWPGKPGAPSVLCLHDWSGRAAQFHRYISPLREGDFTVVTYDAPAHGFSGGEHTNIADMAGALLAVGERFAPLGGIIAHGAAAQVAAVALHAGLKVRRLAMIAPPPSLERSLEQLGVRLGAPPGVVQRVRAAIERALGLPWSSLDLDRLVTDIVAAGETQIFLAQDRADSVADYAQASRLAAAAGAPFYATDGEGHHRILRHRDLARLVAAFMAGIWQDGAYGPSRRG